MAAYWISGGSRLEHWRLSVRLVLHRSNTVNQIRYESTEGVPFCGVTGLLETSSVWVVVRTVPRTGSVKIRCGLLASPISAEIAALMRLTFVAGLAASPRQWPRLRYKSSVYLGF